MIGVAGPDRWDALRSGLALAGPGIAVELGVHTGTSLRIIADTRAELGPVFGFDSFQGLPEDWTDGWPAGTFALDHPPTIPGATIVSGMFADTLPAWSAANPGPIAFLHVDCDLYGSTRDALAALGDRIGPGTVIVFDEMFGYPEWQDHEHRAWTEHAKAAGLTRWSIDPRGDQAIVRIDP